MAGQFPAIGEPDPPRFPLELVRCVDCGLVQLGYTVDPELLFRDYFYRSSVTETMRRHLANLAVEATAMLGKNPETVLDIGCNDGTLLQSFPASVCRIGVDPSSAASVPEGAHLFRRYYPLYLPTEFDLIFSIACFYDASHPAIFAQSVADDLSDNGLWCVEVAYLPDMLKNVSYDAICHEHLTFWDLGTLNHLANHVGLKIVHVSFNSCNGGSVRCYLCHAECTTYNRGLGDVFREHLREIPLELKTTEPYQRFAAAVQNHREELRQVMAGFKGKKIHLLGSSTKFNTILQVCGLDSSLIEAASDRDPRKVGRRTPGTGIPIISEEESRQCKPDLYVCPLSHFRAELLEREKDYLAGGGKILFPLPRVEVVDLPPVSASA